MTRRSLQQGFTAVELLITLFVAAAFLIAGYQLFSVVIKDGGDTRAESTAANIAYDYLRRYSPSAGNPCVASTPVTALAVTADGLANPRVSIVISCPQNDAPAINKIEAFVTYGPSSDKTVKYATFVDTSEGTSVMNNITTGLIAWWRFTGDATAAQGGSSINGTVSNATLTTSLGGAANAAYAFNGTNAVITVPSAIPEPAASFTVSAWIKTANVQSSTNQKVISTTQSGGYTLSISDSLCPSQIGFIAYINGSFKAACASINSSYNNAWIFLTGVFDSSSVRFYLNGTQVAATGTSGALTHGASTVPFCIGGEPNATTCTDPGYFNGSIDDVRLYSRALTPSEVQQLYTAGAL